MLSVTVVIEAPHSLLVDLHTCTVLMNEIIIVMSDLVLVFPLILVLVQNILMNVSKNIEHNFAGLEAPLWVCTQLAFVARVCSLHIA